MLEHFAIDDWNTGMVNGIRAVCDRLDGSMDNVEDEEKEELIALMIFGAVLVLGIAFVFLIVWCMDRCPKCGKHDIMRVSSQIVQIALPEGGVFGDEMIHQLLGQEQTAAVLFRGDGGGKFRPVTEQGCGAEYIAGLQGADG